MAIRDLQRQSHSTIYVIDQEEALGFYRDALGFEVRTDMSMTEEGGLRRLTLSPKGQPDLEIILMQIAAGPAFSAETAEELWSLDRRGALGIGVFETDDIYSDYEA